MAGTAQRTLGKKLLLATASTLLVLGLLAVGLCAYMGVFSENFRVIAPHHAYRSGQVTPESIRQHAKDDNIKTIINLRGQSKSQWYAQELQACQEAGIEHYDIKFDPNYLPTPERLKQLIAIFEKAPQPLLLHCRAGSDRSGLGSALYDMIVLKKSLDDAIDAQMTWHVGHVKKDSGDRFLELYRSTANGQDIREWIEKSYPEIYNRENGQPAPDPLPADDKAER